MLKFIIAVSLCLLIPILGVQAQAKTSLLPPDQYEISHDDLSHGQAQLARLLADRPQMLSYLGSDDLRE